MNAKQLWRELDQREREGALAYPGRNEWRRCADDLARHAEIVEAQIVAFLERLERDCYPHKSWTQAMNEMTSEVNAAFVEALETLKRAADDKSS